MNLANPLSDHNSITTTIHFPDHSSTCLGNVQEDVRTIYRWNTNDVKQYTIAINSDKLQTQLTQLIENIRSASQPNDIDHVVCDVKRVLLEAAEPNKVVSKKSKQRKQRKQPRTHQSPWYDKGCESAKKLYNSLRNHYSRTHLDEDKVKRDEAKKMYVKLCKKKSISHDERLTNSLLTSKFGDTRNY